MLKWCTTCTCMILVCYLTVLRQWFMCDWMTNCTCTPAFESDLTCPLGCVVLLSAHAIILIYHAGEKVGCSCILCLSSSIKIVVTCGAMLWCFDCPLLGCQHALASSWARQFDTWIDVQGSEGPWEVLEKSKWIWMFHVLKFLHIKI